MLEGVSVGASEYRGSWEWGVVACRGVVLCGCEAGYEVLPEHDEGSGEHKDKQSWHYHVPIVGFAAARPVTRPLWSRVEVPTKWSSSGKEDTGDVGPRVVGEGMGRGNGESITARERIRRYTNVSKTNQNPVFVVYYRKEICMHPHAEKGVLTPSLYITQYHCACIHKLRGACARPPNGPDRTPKSENSNLYKHNKYGKHAQTERSHRHGQGTGHAGTKD